MASNNAPAIPGTVISGGSTGAVVSPQHNALFRVGELLKKVVRAVPTAFPNENDVYNAITAIESFVTTGIPAASLRALSEEHDGAAPLEDVTKRIPPAGSAALAAPAMQGIDYDKLAQALIAAQQRAAQQVADNTES